MAFGPDAALELLDQLAATGTLENYHLLHGVRGDLLEKTGRRGEAAEAFTRAAALTENDSERELMLRRAERSAAPAPPT